MCLLFKLFHTDVVEKSDDCLFHSSQVVFVFPTIPPFFFSEPENLRWNIHFIHVMFLLSFPSMFLSGDLSWRCSRASSSSFFCSQILPVDVIQDFGVDLILFLISQCFLIPVHQLIILLLLFISGVLKIHNSILNPFKLFWGLLSYSSLLIQPVQYLLSNLFQRWFLWVGPNPQVFSQDLTWLFLFRSYTQILFKVWRKNDFHQSHAFSKIAFKFFFIIGSTF